MPYHCLIIDDNPIENKAVVLHLKKLPGMEIAATCTDGAEAMKILAETEVDIVFSDIDMPDVSGIELLRSLSRPPAFIFITSFNDYAVESFELNAVDYILKPVTFERLARAVHKAVEYIAVKRQAEDMQLAEKKPKDMAGKHFFYIKETKGYTRLLYSQVIYVESMGDFCKIFTTNGARHVVLVNLRNIERQLPEAMFIRVHKQAIVNLQHICMIRPDELDMSKDLSVPIGNMYRQALLDRTVNTSIITRFG